MYLARLLERPNELIELSAVNTQTYLAQNQAAAVLVLDGDQWLVLESV